MRYLKVLGLTAAVAAALMGFAGGAGATTLTGPSGEMTPTIHLVNENGHVKLANPIANIECNSTIGGTITSHGAGATASGSVSSWTFTGCTNGWHYTVVALGSLQFHYLSPGIGTLTTSGATISSTRLGVTCNYATNNTDLGTFTDSSKTGGVATVDIQMTLPIHSGSSALCGTGAIKVEGSFASTQNLFIDS